MVGIFEEVHFEICESAIRAALERRQTHSHGPVYGFVWVIPLDVVLVKITGRGLDLAMLQLTRKTYSPICIT